MAKKASEQPENRPYVVVNMTPERKSRGLGEVKETGFLYPRRQSVIDAEPEGKNPSYQRPGTKAKPKNTVF